MTYLYVDSNSVDSVKTFRVKCNDCCGENFTVSCSDIEWFKYCPICGEEIKDIIILHKILGL